MSILLSRLRQTPQSRNTLKSITLFYVRIHQNYKITPLKDAWRNLKSQ